MDEPEIEEGSLTAILHGFAAKLATTAHAVRAICRLIFGAVDVPTAWLESQAKRIRVDEEARSKVIRAVAQSSANEAAKDVQIVNRGIDRWARELSRKQENREAVATKVVSLLLDIPPSPDVDEGPSEDFMNIFEEMAEKASSGSLRDLLARVLAGEIRKPGNFSLRTLHFMSTIDQPLAAAIQRARAWVVWDMIPFVPPLNKNPDYQVIFALQEAGIVEVGLEHKAIFRTDGAYLLPFTGTSIGLLLSGTGRRGVLIPNSSTDHSWQASDRTIPGRSRYRIL
ncbi:DUF2806 domain-containing protein [Acidisphaera sp. S103]|uniref:DUF2806 domain-containing protein n=1 Tax=Acidisphaera sp. S103 TaxID=1747223 RepID=UPI00131B367D|nr:DUF2806 domain-containing protein [Acidisphaera sp. S103]